MPADAETTLDDPADGTTAAPTAVSTEVGAGGTIESSVTEAPTGPTASTPAAGDDALDGTASTPTDATDGASDPLENGTGDLGNATDELRNGTVNVSGTVEVGDGGDVGANGSVEAGTGAGADGPDGDDPLGEPTASPTATCSGAARTTSDDASAATAGDGSDGGPSRGGGLPAAAGGAAAVGAVTVAGAALLHRSAAVADGASGSSIRSAVAGWRQGGLGPGEWFRWVLWSVGYSRYDDSDPLAHETRSALYRRIEDAPGVYLTALADDLDVPVSTVRYHLRVLTAESLVTTSMIRGKRRYFPVSTEDEALQVALSDETRAGILAGIARRERATVSTLAREMDRDASTVSYQLQRLSEADLVERERDGRRVWNRLAPHVEPYFEEHGAGVETD